MYGIYSYSLNFKSRGERRERRDLYCFSANSANSALSACNNLTLINSKKFNRKESLLFYINSMRR